MSAIVGEHIFYIVMETTTNYVSGTKKALAMHRKKLLLEKNKLAIWQL